MHLQGSLLMPVPDVLDLGLIAAFLTESPFQPAVHVHYQERILPIVDGLTKFRDLLAAMGGSGEELPERHHSSSPLTESNPEA